MRLYVAYEVGAQNHARANLPLHSDVHLDGARSMVVRVIWGAVIQSASLTQ